ncbi:GntR family transcriptional regulator [Pantoea sp. BAV 3049]|uniref:GntR family transcriptional regulator n=1 Tax=Pantoea sp. BAV 3049 TaxID=2654188 RepID=UPI00131E178C|nr:PLP-dependent aminotransferase family protein [Pantoea sp. BAV 3049]
MSAIDNIQEVNSKDMLIENIIRMIFSGILSNGDFMPSIRNMSERYHLSRNTVLVAYKELESLGFIEGRERSCYVVLGELKGTREARAQAAEETAAMRKAEENPVSTPDLISIAKKLMTDSNATLSRHFIRKWFTNFNASKDKFQQRNEDAKVDRDLKKNLTRYIKIVRGTRVVPENIMIMPGQQEALAVIAHYGKSLKKRPSIILGDPTSPWVLQLFTSLGYEIFWVRVGKEGLDVASFPDTRVDFIYTTPSNNFPSGAKMSTENRKLLLEWSRHHNSLIIENDACFMLGFGREIIPPLSEIYPVPNIIYLYNLAELTGNAASLSVLLLPPALRSPLRQLSLLLASENNQLNRQILSGMLGSSHLMKYLANTLRLRQIKFELAVAGLKKVCPQVDIWGLMHSGYFSFATKERALPDELKNKVLFPLALFCQNPEPGSGLRRYIYPVGSLSVSEIEHINQLLLTHNSPANRKQRKALPQQATDTGPKSASGAGQAPESDSSPVPN